MRYEAYIASTRFGLGPRAEEEAALGRDPKAWLLAQLDELPASSAFADLPSAETVVSALMSARKEGDKAILHTLRHDAKDLLKSEIEAKLWHAVTTQASFIERLVGFWSNHFTVSVKKGAVLGIAGAFEREAIRPCVLGDFSAMLSAVVRHPAMLVYLDNAGSIGPHSKAGQRGHKGLNENLAREIMELHTLGVNGGYTQADVTHFAAILTGWSLGSPRDATPGAFRFFPNRHEPGPETLLGDTYPDTGEAQGEAALQALARHPATARHIAFKLARHFIADAPPEAAVARLAESFQANNGQLGAVYRTLIAMPEIWQSPPPKIKSGYDLVVSAARLCAAPRERMPWCLQSLHFLSDMPFTAPSPAGFGDTAQEIAGPEAVLRRIEWAQGAGHALDAPEPIATLAARALGPLLTFATREALTHASAPREQLALLLGCPEFQRR